MERHTRRALRLDLNWVRKGRTKWATKRAGNWVSVRERVIARGPVVCHDYYHGSLEPWAWAFFKLDLTVAMFPTHTHTHKHYPCTPPRDLQAARTHKSPSSVHICSSACVFVWIWCFLPSSESEGERDFMIAGCWWIISSLLCVCLMNVCLLCWLAYFGGQRLCVVLNYSLAIFDFYAPYMHVPELLP